MLRFRMNLISSKSHSKPLFSHYIKPYMAPFQNIQKILNENLRFTRNSGSKRDFSQNILKSILLWLRPLLVLILKFWSLLIIFVWLWIDLTEENDQNLHFWGICSNLFSSFLPLFLFLILFICFFYVITCLFSLGFLYFVSLSMFRLLDLLL